MEYTAIPVIVVFSYLFIEVLKSSKMPTKWYPLISGIFGVLISIPIYFLIPEYLGVNSLHAALIVGGMSGLAATGSNQVFKQLLKKAKDGTLIVEDKTNE